MSPLTLEIHCNRQTVPYNEDLPTELLLEIFGLAVLSNSESTNTVGSGSPQVSAPRSPGRHRVDQEPDALACPASPSCGPSHPVHQALLLSQICSSWRQIIIGSPKLWTVGLVDVLRDDKRRFFMECVAPNRLNTLLMPSGGLPVSVSLTRETKAGGTKHVASTASPTSIVAASRWKYFKVNQYTFGDFRAIKIVAAPSAAVDTSDSLRHLSHTDRRLRARRERFSRVIEDRLSRRTRAMEDRLMREDVEQMPFAQLTHLDLEEQDPSTCLLILRQSTNLVFATLTTNDWDGMADTWNESTFFDDDEDADDDNIALPFLEALQVQFIGGRHPVACVSPFFNPLTLPSLHTLDLTLRENVVWDPLDFSAFQMRSPNIARISLTGCSISSQDLFTLLRLAPAVMSLTLINCKNCIDDAFLEAFCYDKWRIEQLVPRLEEIDWQFIGCRFGEDTFEAAIRSRFKKPPRGMARLKKVSLGESSFGPILLHCLQDLVDQGLEVRLVGNNTK